MKFHSIKVNNYRSFKQLEEMKIGSLTTIIGKNDVGKSNILRAIQSFIDDKPKLDTSDLCLDAENDENILIEIAFHELPETIEIEEGVQTSFQEEMLVDNQGFLRIQKIYDRNNPSKHDINLIVGDYVDDRYFNLATIKQNELNKKCEEFGIDYSVSGRGITNKSKREAIRKKAEDESVDKTLRAIKISNKDNLWKLIVKLFPKMLLFESDTKLGVGETTFQNQFNPIIKTTTSQAPVVEARDRFTESIKDALQDEVDKIFEYLKQHTDAFLELKAVPTFSWEKAVNFDIRGKDRFDIENSLEKRGSGIRRLLMVAFFQYLAERETSESQEYVFAVEEPENCLHPGLQRELIYSFRKLVDKNYQIILTSHSPVFAGNSPREDLTLIVREDGVAKGIQVPDLNIKEVADELGVEPSDQIITYNACIFVEGPSDIHFYKVVAEKLKEGGVIDAHFDDKEIGFIICGGETIKQWVNFKAMHRISRRFGVVIDSDKKRAGEQIPQRKLNYKKYCEDEGGVFYILRKTEMENYLHRNAIENSGRELEEYDDYSDMKSIFGNNVYKVIDEMTSDEILEMDRYEDNGVEHHELKEIVESFLALC